MIQGLKLTLVGYSAIVEGNDGEAELIISASCGQDGRAALVVTEMEIDGGGRVRFMAVGSSRRSLPMTSELANTIKAQMTAWAFSGYEPNKEQAQDIRREIDGVMDQIITRWTI